MKAAVIEISRRHQEKLGQFLSETFVASKLGPSTRTVRLRVAEDPDHMIHFNGEHFLGPYPDVMPKNK